MSFLKHLRIAQRRHGVHSPFVYLYGDSVLKYNHFTLRDIIYSTSRAKKIESMIQDFIAFSRANEVFIDGVEIKPKNLEISGEIPLVPIPKVLIFSRDSKFEEIEDSSVIIAHGTKKMTKNLHKVFLSSGKPLMLLDLYYFQILICHQMFKNKQHYQLK